MARRIKTAEYIGSQTMRALVANSRNVERGGQNRSGTIMKANSKLLLPIYRKQGNIKAVKAMEGRLGLSNG